MEPELSIVIPVYNRRDIVGRTLSSVRNQTYRPLELILVDNNSTDGSYEYLRRWQFENDCQDMRVKLFRERVAGASSARNRGLAEATAPWVMFFDSDDVMLPDHCRRAMAEARRNPDASVIGWDTEIVLPSGKKIVGRFPKRDYQWNNLFHGGFATQRWMARTSLVRSVGGWNGNVLFWDDVELGSRLIASGSTIVKSQGKPTVRVLPTEGSITEAPDGFAAKMTAVLEVISRNLGPSCRRWIPFKYVLGASFYGFGHPDSAPMLEKARTMVHGADVLVLRLLIAYLWFIPKGGTTLISLFIKR